jgi:predicted nucleotidyltransferase
MAHVAVRARMRFNPLAIATGPQPRTSVQQLSRGQNELVWSMAHRLTKLDGVQAVMLGGSYARGRAQPDSDIDIGILYSEDAPFSIAELRALLEPLNDTPAPVIADLYEWGRWVNGGAWLSIAGQRVDVLYRSREHIERVIQDCRTGRYEVDYAQQPPFGYFSATCLGEMAVCVSLSDPHGWLARFKELVAPYPVALQRSLIQDCLWSAELTLAAFAPKFARRADAYGTAGCLARTVNQLVLALFALNETYPLNDKTALSEITQFERAPAGFAPRVQRLLAHPGSSAAALSSAVGSCAQLLRETCELCPDLYTPRYRMTGIG